MLIDVVSHLLTPAIVVVDAALGTQTAPRGGFVLLGTELSVAGDVVAVQLRLDGALYVVLGTTSGRQGGKPCGGNATARLPCLRSAAAAAQKLSQNAL